MVRSTLVIFALLLLCISPFHLFASNDENIIKEFEEYAPKLKIEYVIQTAKEYSEEQGYKTEKYFIQSVKYDSSGKEWMISFEGKMPAPGNHFGIVINDSTEEIQLFPGE